MILCEVGHADGGDGTLNTFVAQASAATVKRLLTVVDGKHGEDDRHLATQIEGRDTWVTELQT